MHIKNISLILLAIGSFLFVMFFAFYPQSMQEHSDLYMMNQQDTQKPMYLFVHNAGAGTFEKIDDENYLLTLHDIDADVTYFSDRPVRDVGRVSLVRLLGTLGFEIGDPPNAAVVVEMDDGREETVVVELIDPVYNRDDDTLIYHATLLHDDKTHIFSVYGANSHEVVLESFLRSTLLIDDCAKDGEVFCGSTAKCIDPKKDVCGGTKRSNSNKNDADKKCHDMKLEEAIKIAEGKESECLIYGHAKLNKDDHTCDDHIGGWTIGLDLNMKGEASRCDARCIVVESEQYKSGEGVARVEYTCHDKKNEQGDKNVYCPQIDYQKDHYYKDVQKALIDKYDDILHKAKDHHTSYEHHYCVTTGMPYKSNKHFATDCSGLGGFTLFDQLPYHYKLLDDARQAHTKADRPLAEDFYDFIKDQDIKDHKSNDQCWMRVQDVKDAQRGDFLVVKYDARAGENSTGHVMWIDKSPQWHSAAKHYEVTVIDSANSGHGDDTRNDKNTYNCKGSKDCGIGRGEMTIYASDDEDGHPVKYKWNTKLSSDQYVEYKKDCPDDEICRLEGIVIGRVLDCKSK